MRIPRIYQATELAEQTLLILDEEAANHIVRVLRLGIDASLIIFNGQGGEYEAVITEISKRQVQVKLKSFIQKNNESPLIIHLGQVISRGEKMDFTIQKAVELGVTEITPLFSERCEVKLSQERWEKKLNHWQKIIINACEQSGRTILPKINKPIELVAWFANCHAEKKIILHPHETNNLKTLTKVNHFAITIGPEGGFSEDEIALAKLKEFDCLQIGPRILRTETAALTMLAALQTQFGDF